MDETYKPILLPRLSWLANEYGIVQVQLVFKLQSTELSKWKMKNEWLTDRQTRLGQLPYHVRIGLGYSMVCKWKENERVVDIKIRTDMD